uniref:Uncharacterized protein n=1 Tax=Podoviridae sp. ct8Lf7 TaxID=2827723 RepID=A0A8S5S097_9CAUD|nr:MAG TPA: hypothetical protein [Podoviridae sp. ct8Lf7]
MSVVFVIWITWDRTFIQIIIYCDTIICKNPLISSCTIPIIPSVL